MNTKKVISRMKVKAAEHEEKLGPTCMRDEPIKPKEERPPPPTKWGPTPTTLTKEDERLIVGKVLEIAVRVIMSNHVYILRIEPISKSQVGR